jgi:diguanylate cyclase (GGDEF)-like protein
MTFQSIGTKIQWLTGMAFLVGLAAVLSIQTSGRIQTTWDERMDANLRIVKGLSAPARGAISLQDKSAINSYMELLSSDPRAAAIVITSNKSVMVSQQSINHFDLPIADLVQFGIKTEDGRDPQTITHGDYEFIAVPVKDPALRTIGTVSVAWDTKGLLDKTWASAIKEAFALFGLATGVLMILVFAIRSLVTVPITKIASMLEQSETLETEKLNRTARLYNRRSDEIGVFARALEKFYVNASEKVQLSDKLDSALSNMSQGLCMFDPSGKLVVNNQQFAKMYGIHAEQLKSGVEGAELIRLVVDAGKVVETETTGAPDENYAWLTDGKSGGKTLEFADGTTFTVSSERTPSGGWVTTHSDVSELKRAQKTLVHLAGHDPLTNLPNRRRFQEIIDVALQRGERRVMAILFLDLDKFKYVNDTLGHDAGDKLLKVVSKRLENCVRSGDTVCRLGGDEFAILQMGDSQPESAEALALRITQQLCEPVMIGGEQVKIGVSTGIAIAPADGTTAEVLLKRADLAVYVAKSSGRNTHRFFVPEMEQVQIERQTLERDLRVALENNQFEIRYQPIISASAEKLIGCEALLRWNHPEKGQISPGGFIQLAEETGLIVPIGEWVLREACRQAATWPANTSIAVNISAVQLHRADLFQVVFSALAASQLSATRLHLEITESVMLKDSEATSKVLNRIREFGVQIVLDDFGTGYSALNYLSRFSFDKIKIDRSFSAGIADNKVNKAIIDAVVGIGKSMGAIIVAEGVETQAQKRFLQGSGIDQYQGFLFSPPIASTELNRLYFESPPQFKKSAQSKRGR